MNNINQNQSTEKKSCCLNKMKSCWQKFSSSKLSIALSCVFIGVAGTLLMQSFSKNHRDYLVIHDNFPFHPPLAFADDNFFAEIHEMEKRIDQEFINHQKHMREIFEKAQKNSDQSNVSKVLSHEDSENYYYQLDFSGFKKEEIIVAVKDNVVSFSAESKRSEDKKNQSFNSSSSFHYSFSIATL